MNIEAKSIEPKTVESKPAEPKPAEPKPGSRIRRKLTVEVELILEDGTNLTCEVFVAPGERVLDLLNAPNNFMPVRLENQEILLVSKRTVVVCKPLDQPS